MSCSPTAKRPASATLSLLVSIVAWCQILAGCAADPRPPAETLREADRAYADRDRGTAGEALRSLEEVLTADPDQPEALWRLARLEVWRGRPEAARDAARRAIARDPGSAPARLWAGYAGALALARRPVGDRLIAAPAVQEDLERALALDPTLARAHLGLALLALALDEEPAPFPYPRPDAGLHLRLARRLRPGLPGPHLLLARSHLAAGDPASARRSLAPLLAPPPEARAGTHFPDAQIGEWQAASTEARRLVEWLR